MVPDPAQDRELFDAAQWKLVAASLSGTLEQLKPTQLRSRIAKAQALDETWRDLVARHRRAIQGKPVDVSEFASFERKSALFTAALRRFEARLQEIESSQSSAEAPASKQKRVAASASRQSGQVRPVEELLGQLARLHFFEGYASRAAALAQDRIRQQYTEGLSGPQREHFERFPGFALTFISIEGEWDFEPYKPLVELVAQNCFGMFRPTRISDRRNAAKGTATLSFTVDGEKHSRTVEDSGGWVPPEFLELIEEAFAAHCGNLHFHETFRNALIASSASSWTICTPRAYKALQKARLVPGEL